MSDTPRTDKIVRETHGVDREVKLTLLAMELEEKLNESIKQRDNYHIMCAKYILALNMIAKEAMEPEIEALAMEALK